MQIGQDGSWAFCLPVLHCVLGSSHSESFPACQELWLCSDSVGVWTQGPLAFRASALGEQWGAVPQVKGFFLLFVFQVKVLLDIEVDVRFQLFTPRRLSGSCEFFLIMCCCASSGVYSGFNLRMFSFTQSTGVIQTISGFLPEEHALYIAVDLVYPWEQVSSKASILDQNPLANSMCLR